MSGQKPTSPVELAPCGECPKDDCDECATCRQLATEREPEVVPHG
jgi:hypothetical protein